MRLFEYFFFYFFVFELRLIGMVKRSNSIDNFEVTFIPLYVVRGYYFELKIAQCSEMSSPILFSSIIREPSDCRTRLIFV